MAIEFKLPDLGENITGGDIVSVLVAVGDTISRDQPVVEIETDKAVVEVPSSVAGKVAKIHVNEGDTVKVGQVIVTVDGDAAAAPEPAKKVTAKTEAPPAQTPSASPAPKATPVEAPKAPAVKAEPAPAQPAPAAMRATDTESEDSVPAGPATRRLARELGVDLVKIKGTGDHGRITREDVIAAARRKSQPAAEVKPAAFTRPAMSFTAVAPPGVDDNDHWGAVKRDKLPKIRKVIALNMHKSASTIPHVTNFDDADITDLEALRVTAKSDYEAAGLKLTTMPFILRAVAVALLRHPKLNASIDVENEQIIYKQYVNLGIAIDSDRGLVVPNIRNAERMGIAQLTQALKEVVDTVRANKFTPDDLRGGTFTLSNLGAIGGTYSTPIINPPEVGILLVGRSRQLPVVMPDGLIKARLMMPLSISYDHRLVDGADAARFLNDVKMLLEAPSRLLLAP